jgi:hypothetical protein
MLCFYEYATGSTMTMSMIRLLKLGCALKFSHFASYVTPVTLSLVFI